MRQAHLIHSYTVVASASVLKNRFVTAAGAHAGAGATAIGVCQMVAASGEAFAAGCIGSAVIEAGAAFAVGDWLESDASGRAIPFVAGQKLAYALEAAAGAGSLAEVAICLPASAA